MKPCLRSEMVWFYVIPAEILQKPPSENPEALTRKLSQLGVSRMIWQKHPAYNPHKVFKICFLTQVLWGPSGMLRARKTFFISGKFPKWKQLCIILNPFGSDADALSTQQGASAPRVGVQGAAHAGCAERWKHKRRGQVSQRSAFTGGKHLCLGRCSWSVENWALCSSDFHELSKRSQPRDKASLSASLGGWGRSPNSCRVVLLPHGNQVADQALEISS